MKLHRRTTGNKNFLFVFFAFLFCFCLAALISSRAFAGEVLTKDARDWARKTVMEEKGLGAKTARNSVAVVPFVNRTGQTELDPLQKGMALMLITDLSTVEGVQVVERVKVQALMDEIGLGAAGLTDSRSAPRVGKLAGAQWLVGGTLDGRSELLKAISESLDVPGEKSLGQASAQGPLAEIFKVEKDLLFELLKYMKVDITPEQEKKLRRPCSQNPEALMLLFKATDWSDKGEYDKAAEFYRKALEKDKSVCIASTALKELKALGLVKEKSRTRGMLRSLKDKSSITDGYPPEDPDGRPITPAQEPPTVGGAK